MTSNTTEAVERARNAAKIERKMIEELDRRRVTTLAQCGLMLSKMAGGEAPEVIGFDAANLYAEVQMALGIEDADDGCEDIALEIARDHPEGCLLADRFDALAATQHPESDVKAGAGEVERRAYRMAYAPLRSAQHALDLIARNATRNDDAIRDLAHEESGRIELAFAALSTPPAEPVKPEAWMIERLTGKGYGSAREIIDAQKFDPTKPGFWVAGARERHRVTPLFASPQPSSTVEDTTSAADLIAGELRAQGDTVAIIMVTPTGRSMSYHADNSAARHLFAKPASERHADLRKEFAKIIDPRAWEVEIGSLNDRIDLEGRRCESLTKVDELIVLIPDGEGR